MWHVSILTMLAVTLERYNALCHPFKLRMACTASTTVKANVAIWIIAYVLTIPFAVMTVHEDANFYDGTTTKVCRTKVNDDWRYCYVVFIFILFFALPLLVLIFIYSKIIRQLMSDTLKTLTRNDKCAITTIKMRKQVVLMLIFIVVLFFVSLFPIRVVSLWLIFTPAEQVSRLGLEVYYNLISWARILMYVNSAGNPIIYITTSTKFKMALRRLVRRNTGSDNSTCLLQYRLRQPKGKFVSSSASNDNNPRFLRTQFKPLNTSMSGSETGKTRTS